MKPLTGAADALERGQKRWGWFFIAGSTLLISVFAFYPMVQAFIMSLHAGMGTNLKYAGAANYSRLLSDSTLRKALFNTILYLIIQVPLMILLALALSVFLNNKKLRFRSFFRIAIFLPCVTSLVSYSLIMKNIFATKGLMNQVLLSIGAIDSPINWITNEFWAKVIIIIAITWRWTGYNMVFFLSGLQTIDPAVYEAAEMDGASEWKKFIHVTVPLLKPIILFTTITSTIGTLQLFDEVRNITNGGPANGTVTISQYIYNLCFQFSPNFGYAAAVAFMTAVLILLLSAVQLRFGGDKNG